MTAYAIVRTRIKAGRSQEVENRIREIEGGVPKRKGLRRTIIVDIGGDRRCTILEWDSFDDLVRGRAENRRFLDTIRDLLEDLGGGLGVTYPVSGEAIFEFIRPATEGHAERMNHRRAWSIVRYSVKPGHDGAIEAMNQTIAKGRGGQPTSPCRLAIVKVGDRAFCLVSEWDSNHDLTASSAAMVQRLEEFRDILEPVPGGRDIAQTVSGEVVLEFKRGDLPSAPDS